MSSQMWAQLFIFFINKQIEVITLIKKWINQNCQKKLFDSVSCTTALVKITYFKPDAQASYRSTNKFSTAMQASFFPNQLWPKSAGTIDLNRSPARFLD